MSDFVVSEAEESEGEDLDPSEKKRLKRLKKMESDEEEEDDDDEQGVVAGLIDDDPIDESDGEDSDGSGGSKKRKNSDDDEFDDRLEEDDYDLIEENLGVKVERRKRFKRLKRIEDEESDNEGGEQDEEEHRDKLANELFDSDNNDEDASERDRIEPESYGDEEDEYDGSDEEDGFIVDDENRPIKGKKKRKPIYTDAALQLAQDVFGVNFDYDEYNDMSAKYGDDYEFEEESEYDYEDEEDGERRRKPKKAVKKKPTKKSIFEIYEPSELKRGHFTDRDNEIRNTDIPERMQLREIPVTSVPEGSDELEDEAKWIYKYAFQKLPITKQDPLDRTPRKGNQTIGKIKKALDFMRNQHYEVPFIAFYRKEYVQPELSINDLWRVYKFDAKWCQLRNRKQTLISLYEKMRDYQAEQVMKDVDAPIPDSVRIIKDEDIDRLRVVQTTEELKDVHSHFLLYYAHEVSAMQESVRAKEREQAKAAKKANKTKKINEDGEEIDDDEQQEDENEEEEETEKEEPRPQETVKQAVRSGPYSMCRKYGIDGFAKRFGLTPDQFAENLRDNYQRHEVDQETASPLEVAKEYCSNKIESPEEVLKAGKYMVSMQLAREPLVRSCVRETFFERAKFDIIPTKKGIKEIDENHCCYSMKYVKGKPIRDLTGDQFLKLNMAEEDKLLTIKINEEIEGITSSSSFLDEIKQLYHRDEFSKQVQDWNQLRAECVEIAMTKMLMPDLVKELRTRLLEEAKECVLKACCRKLYNWIKVAPITVEFGEDDDDEWDTSKGIRVMAIAYVPDYSQASFACIAYPDGECSEFLRIPNLLKRKNSYREDEKMQKEADLLAIRNFILTKKPHVIVVGGESREALMVSADVKEIVSSLVEDEQFPQLPVEIIDNELAKIYANSIRGENDFRDYPLLLRQAISLARRIRDPLVEFSQLCTSDDEILCLRYHPLQDQIPKEELLEALNLEFVNRTNEVGVDVNSVVANLHSGNLIQYICGLGPRKGAALIKLLKQTNQRLENRTQLVTACHMGPKVFINCAGFIKIDTNSLGDSTDAYVEVLDGSRVHPETYEWARKMAVDALEYDDEDANPAGALEEILEAPERLKDLDLDAFAVELERQGFGNKSITLYDIRSELNHRYKDMRTPFQSANPEEMFDMLTKESPESFYIGKMITATVTGISHKKPERDQLDAANPVRNDETGLWQCPFCLKNDFPELSEVWQHFDNAGGCPGQAIGIRIRLDNGVSGYIHIKNLSDEHVTNPNERVNRGQIIYCRITKIDVEKYAIDATSKSSDLADKNHEWRPAKDPFYNHEAEAKIIQTQEDAKKVKQRQTYMKRVIVHPAFHNISYAEAEKLMTNMEQGEVIIRPSSKGADHLTVTWKVSEHVCQHIDVREEGKENAFSLGQTLWIGSEEFEDLDEIIARHVNPMAAYARDLLSFRYYKDTEGGLRDKAEEFLKEEKKKNPSKIHYIISVSKNYPGKFMLSYLPRARCKHEFVTITPEGFRFRGQMFDTVNILFRWFKEHFRDPLPGTVNTPRTGLMTNRTTPFLPHTPSANMPNVNPDPMQRIPPGMPNHVMHNMGQVPTHTPHYSATPGGYTIPTYPNTPYTPSGQTPFMTPYHTPHPGMTQTPRYGQQTPQPVFLHPGNVTPAHRTPSHSVHAQRQTPQSNSIRNAPTTTTDPNDWRIRAEEWAKQKQREATGTPRSDSSRSTPRTGNSTPRYEDNRNKLTPRYDNDVRGTPRQVAAVAPNNHRSPRTPSYKSPHPSNNYEMQSPRVPSQNHRGHYDQYGKSPRYSPAPSTPRTINSPRSMVESSLGDATPLYDEN